MASISEKEVNQTHKAQGKKTWRQGIRWLGRAWWAMSSKFHFEFLASKWFSLSRIDHSREVKD